MTYQEVRDRLTGKTVLVTGHTGFKGSWLSIWLLEMGCRVVGCALENPERKANYWLSGVGEKIDGDYRVDIRDAEALWGIFQREQPDFVFHLAAQALVRASYADPAETYAVNVMGTVNVLECVRRLRKDVTAVMVTTDKCYENMGWDRGYRETDRLGGYDPYSSSKACCELAIASWRRAFLLADGTFRKRASSVRAGNVIGGGDWAEDRIVPDCIRALESGRPIELRNPAAIRPWQHVLEPLWGYIKLAAMMDRGEVEPDAWNFGPELDCCVPVETIASELVRLFGRGSCRTHAEPGAPKEMKILRLDNTKAKETLGWRPVWNVREALSKTADWYQNYAGQDVYAMCVGQIQEYINTVEEWV